MVHLFGQLESGRSFLALERRSVPHFFVRAEDAARAAELGAAPLTPTHRVTLEREPVVRVEVPVPAAMGELAARLMGSGIDSFEADLRFAQRYLIDRGIRGAVAIEGPRRPGEGIDLIFEDPVLTPASFAPRLRVLSFDIETDPQARRLLAISLHGCGASEVLLLTPSGFSCPPGAIPFASEAELLAGFCRRVRELDPDVLTGWNVIDFDLAVLERIAARLDIPSGLELGRGRGALHLQTQTARSPWLSSRASVPGRVVLDGIQLLRGAAVRMEEYSLDFVARAVLGEGKVVGGSDRAEEILRMFKEDRPRFVAYSLTDARLVLEILERLRLVELAVEHSLLTGLTPDRMGSSVAAFEFLYLSELARRGFVGPSAPTSRGRGPGEGAGGVGVSAGGAGGGGDARAAEESDPEPMLGGHVLEPEPGLYRNVLVFDFLHEHPQ